MIRGLRYIADKLERFTFWLVAKWNNFLDKIKL